jgi:hypothetical protein
MLAAVPPMAAKLQGTRYETNSKKRASIASIVREVGTEATAEARK